MIIKFRLFESELDNNYKIGDYVKLTNNRLGKIQKIIDVNGYTIFRNDLNNKDIRSYQTPYVFGYGDIIKKIDYEEYKKEKERLKRLRLKNIDIDPLGEEDWED